MGDVAAVVESPVLPPDLKNLDSQTKEGNQRHRPLADEYQWELYLVVRPAGEIAAEQSEGGT